MSESSQSEQEALNSSNATRRRLLDAALAEFGERGFDSVSTRDLAERARVNQAAIPYHFGGKQGLHLAVAEDLVQMVQSSVGVTAGGIRERLEAGPVTAEEGELLIATMIGKMVEFLVGADQARFRAAFVIRELMHPSEVFDLLYEGYMRDIHSILTRLVAILLGEDPNAESSILRAHALLGQMIVFGAGRELIRRRAEWDDFTREHLEQIKETVTETFVASIRGMRLERGL
ncbi:MAG: CerR family C-terminal domain-containing protein [Verrucomicrobiae bacterium]|nr:CerR family C-terminal domain-containing protein [Verrucomicrobiae bacterium]